MKFHSRLPAAMMIALILDCGMEAQTNPAVTVDFGAPVPNLASLSGFIATMSPEFDLRLVEPLKPNLWRLAGLQDIQWTLDTYDHATALPVRVVVELGYLWSVAPWRNPDWKPPYQDWPAWENFVRQVAQAGKGRNFIYKVWNEPNLDTQEFWLGTQEQLFETYLRAYKVIREVLGADAPVAGPSTASWDRDYIQAFLDFCKASGCEVNIIDWHELHLRNAGVIAIADHLLDVRKSFLQNPAYAGLRIREIHLGEVIGPYMQYQPGGILAHFYYMEKGGADAASKSCWGNNGVASSDTINECQVMSLNGLLTNDKFRPRAGWWAYKTYADGFESRVASTITDPNIVALASSASAVPGTAQVLLGHMKASDVTRTTASVSLTLKNLGRLLFLGNAGAVHLKVERIPDTGTAALAQPTLIRELDVAVQSGSAQTILSGLAPGDEWRITIGLPPAGTAVVPKALVNAASFGTTVAPGSLVSLFATNLPAKRELAATLPLPTTLGGISVMVNDIAAPLVAVLPEANQVNLQLPFETLAGLASLTVLAGSTTSAPLQFAVSPNSAEIFRFGAGRAVAQNAGVTLNQPDSPAAPGDAVVVYLTGPGTLNGYAASGRAAPASPLARAAIQCCATIGGVPAHIDYLGLTPGFVGLLQANLLAPLTAPKGEQPVVVAVGGVASQPANITVAPLDPARLSRYHRVLFDEAHNERFSLSLDRARQIQPEHPEWQLLSRLPTDLADEFILERNTDTAFTADFLSPYDAVILAEPRIALTAAEQSALAAYVRGGGGLFVFGACGGDANTIRNPNLRPYGITFHGPCIVRMQSGAPNLNFWKVPTLPHPATASGSGLSFSWGSPIAVTGAAVPVAITNQDCWEDLDNDKARDSNEPAGPFVVAAAAMAEAGRVVAASNSNYFDDLYDTWNNAAFFRDMLRWVSRPLSPASARLPYARGGVIQGAPETGRSEAGAPNERRLRIRPLGSR